MIEPLFLLLTSILLGAFFFLPTPFFILSFSILSFAIAALSAWCFAKTFSQNRLKTFILGFFVIISSALNLCLLGDNLIQKGCVDNLILIVFIGFIIAILIQMTRKAPRENLVKQLIIDVFQVIFSSLFTFFYLIVKLYDGNYYGFILALLFAFIVQSIINITISLVSSRRENNFMTQKTQAQILCVFGIASVILANFGIKYFLPWVVTRNNDLLFLILTIILSTVLSSYFNLPIIHLKTSVSKKLPSYLLSHLEVQVLRGVSPLVYGFAIAYFVAILVQI